MRPLLHLSPSDGLYLRLALFFRLFVGDRKDTKCRCNDGGEHYPFRCGYGYSR